MSARLTLAMTDQITPATYALVEQSEIFKHISVAIDAGMNDITQASMAGATPVQSLASLFGLLIHVQRMAQASERAAMEQAEEFDGAGHESSGAMPVLSAEDYLRRFAL